MGRFFQKQKKKLKQKAKENRHAQLVLPTKGKGRVFIKNILKNQDKYRGCSWRKIVQWDPCKKGKLRPAMAERTALRYGFHPFTAHGREVTQWK